MHQQKYGAQALTKQWWHGAWALVNEQHSKDSDILTQVAHCMASKLLQGNEKLGEKGGGDWGGNKMCNWSQVGRYPGNLVQLKCNPMHDY